MSDREYMRKLVDEILGAERNKLPEQSGKFGVDFKDDNVCKFYLVGFCPFQQFQNTKSDIGACPSKYHDDKIRELFQTDPDSLKYKERYEREFCEFLERLVNDLERRLRRGKERLEVKPTDPTSALNPANDEFEEKRTLLELQIKENLEEIEKFGEQGKIQEAKSLMQKVEESKEELEKLRIMEQDNPSYRLEKKMEICATCGAFLVVGDAQKRIEAHFEGKQHNGWAKVRETLAELKIRPVESIPVHKEDEIEPGELGEIVEEREHPSSSRPRSRSREYRHDDRRYSKYYDSDRSSREGHMPLDRRWDEDKRGSRSSDRSSYSDRRYR